MGRTLGPAKDRPVSSAISPNWVGCNLSSCSNHLIFYLEAYPKTDGILYSLAFNHTFNIHTFLLCSYSIGRTLVQTRIRRYLRSRGGQDLHDEIKRRSYP